MPTQHWGFVQFKDDQCTQGVYMNLENPDRRLVTDNWEYIEKDEDWNPSRSKSLVVLYELQSRVGVTAEHIYDAIGWKGPEVVRNKAEHRRMFTKFNCR